MSDGFLDAMGKFLEESEDFPTCPDCGNDDTVLDDNGDYEFFFCTDVECGWESKPGEYGCEVHDHYEE